MTPADWLIDKSVLARLARPNVNDAVWPRIRRGAVGVSILTELEMGHSAQSTSNYLETRQKLVDELIAVPLPCRAEARAREVQAALVESGQHRAVSIPDLLIAATAEVEGLTVLHYDADFDLIASISGQSTEWIVPQGSI